MSSTWITQVSLTANYMRLNNIQNANWQFSMLIGPGLEIYFFSTWGTQLGLLTQFSFQIFLGSTFATTFTLASF